MLTTEVGGNPVERYYSAGQGQGKLIKMKGGEGDGDGYNWKG